MFFIVVELSSYESPERHEKQHQSETHANHPTHFVSRLAYIVSQLVDLAVEQVQQVHVRYSGVRLFCHSVVALLAFRLDFLVGGIRLELMTSTMST